MARETFTDDDEGKDVVNDRGDRIGIVTEVHGETAHVDPDPDLTDSIKSKLGWGDINEDTYPLQVENVHDITDDEIHVGGDL